LENYLEHHQTTRDGNGKILQNFFTKYLVAQCWEKMSQWIGDWSSQGYIYLLGTINMDQLRYEVASPSAPMPKKYVNRNNAELAVLVTSMVEKGQMASVIMERCGRPEFRSEQLTNLVASFRVGGIYDETTCVEFHRLLLATLLAYGHALIALKERSEGMESIAHKYDRVYICASLLRQIASSLMLRQHLWASQVLLSVPVTNSIAIGRYKEYTGFRSEGCNDYILDGAGSDHLEGGSMSKVEVFLGWIRRQVAHLLALGTISRAFGVERAKIPQLSLVIVQYPQQQQPAMEPWTVTVDKLLDHTTSAPSEPPLLNAESIKMTILDRTRATMTNQHPVFHSFKGIHLNHQPAFGHAMMHSEMILAAFMTYSQKILGETDVDLIGLFQVMFYPHDCDARPADTLRRIWTKTSSQCHRNAAQFAGSSWTSSGTQPTNSVSVAAILPFSLSSCRHGFLAL
jgi:hypothetical protein